MDSQNTNEKKWIIGAVIVVAVVVIGYIFFGIPDVTILTKSTIIDKKETIGKSNILTVGAILPMTGPTAQFGEIFKTGLDAGLAGNSQIKVIYEDSKSDAVGAVAAFQKLVNIDKVDVIVSILSKTSVPLVPIAKENKIPLIISLVAATNTTSPDNDYVYRLFWGASKTANLFVDRIADQKITRVALLQGKNEAAQSNADIIIPQLEIAGIKVAYQTFQDSDTDFRTQLAKAKQAQPEVVAILSVPASQWKNIITQVKELGITVPIYDLFGVFQNPGTPEALGMLADGVYTIATPFHVGEYGSEVKAELAKKNIKLNGLTSFGYDTASLIKDFVKNKVMERESIVQYMKNLRSFNGISSPYTVDDAHNIEPTIIRAQYINGAVVKSEK